MLLDKFVRWVQNKAPDRSGVLSTATALVVDVTRDRDKEAASLISFDRWRMVVEKRALPSQAVAFLQIFSDWTIASIVDVQQRRVPIRVQLPTKELGTFAADFLRVHNAGDTRSILQAPKWWYGPDQSAVGGEARTHAALAMSATGTTEGEGAAPAGIVMPGDKPPKGPRVEALVTVAEETTTITSLPVIAGQPL